MENKSPSEKGLTRRKTQYTCSLCTYKTDRKNNMKRHYISMHHHSSKILECCGIQFLSKAALRFHTKTLHREGYVCSLCKRSFCRRALLRRHMSVHNGLKEFSCELCTYATSHKSNLERHQFRIHGISQKKQRKQKVKKTTSLPTLNLSSREEEIESANISNLSDYQPISYTPELSHSTSAQQTLTTTEIVNRVETEGEEHFSPRKEITRLCSYPYKCFECKSVFKKQSEYILHCDKMHPPRDALEMTIIKQSQDKILNLVIHPPRDHL